MIVAHIMFPMGWNILLGLGLTHCICGVLDLKVIMCVTHAGIGCVSCDMSRGMVRLVAASALGAASVLPGSTGCLKPQQRATVVGNIPWESLEFTALMVSLTLTIIYIQPHRYPLAIHYTTVRTEAHHDHGWR